MDTYIEINSIDYIPILDLSALKTIEKKILVYILILLWQIFFKKERFQIRKLKTQKLQEQKFFF